MDKVYLQEFFSSTAALAPLCTQNGWPDPASMRIDLLEEDDRQVLCAITFDEVIMEGSGCEAGRAACWGRFRVQFDARGRVVGAEIETGERKE